MRDALDHQPPLDDKEAWKEWIRQRNVMPERLRHEESDTTVETTFLGGIRTYVASPTDAHAGVYFFVHGGGFVFDGGEICRRIAMATAHDIGARTYAVDYRMPPDHPYPTPLDDCVGAYAALADMLAPDRVVVGGISAGATLRRL